MAGLFGKTMRAAVTPPYPWVRDFFVETSLAIRRSLIPLIVLTAGFSYGSVQIGIGGVVEPLGTPDRYGAGLVTGWPREPGLWIAMLILGGVVGASVTADLGARKVREEIDAISVLGVDVVKTLVVPRVLALVVAAQAIACIMLAVALSIGYLTAPRLNTEPAVFLEGARAFITSEDLFSMMLKNFFAALFVGTVACYKGLNASGGSEGVGRAVKETVIISFFSLWLFHTLWNEAYLAWWRDVALLRG